MKSACILCKKCNNKQRELSVRHLLFPPLDSHSFLLSLLAPRSGGAQVTNLDFELGSDNGKPHQEIKDRKENEASTAIPRGHWPIAILLFWHDSMIISSEQNLGLGTVNSWTANQPRDATLPCGSPLPHLHSFSANKTFSIISRMPSVF